MWHGYEARAVFIAAAMFAALVYAAPVAAKDACITDKCHAVMLEHKFVHGPVAVQDCAYCHVGTGGHSFRLAAKGAELCYVCHDAMPPSHGDVCTSCHDPHGSEREYQLKPGVKAGR
jgi:predicted CXXCH cytochrome family protein